MKQTIQIQTDSAGIARIPIRLDPCTDYTLTVEDGHRAEPETCVWTHNEDRNMWQVGCLHSGSGIREAIGYRWCPFCRLQIEFRNPYKHPEEGSGVEIPDGCRVLEPWEVEVAAELRLDKPAEYYMRSADQCSPKRWGCRVTTQTKWDSENSEYAVPAHWSPMPKCRDCGGETAIETMGNSHIYYVRCNTTGGCTVGPTKANKAEAVKAYPKGE